MAKKMSIFLGESTLIKYTKHDQTIKIDAKVKKFAGIPKGTYL